MKTVKNTPWIAAVACSALFSLTATSAFADSVVYQVLPAEKHPYYGQYSGGHALWLPGIGTDFVFTSDNPGIFTENMDDTATLTGTVVSKGDSGKKFEVAVDFSGRTDTAPPGSPKKELKWFAYSPHGPIDPSTWHYYTDWGGTLSGLMTYAGAEITLDRTGPAFQVGDGANGKNLHFGGSGWFTWEVAAHPTSGSFQATTGQGDFNLDFHAASEPVPEPGTVLLLGSGLVGLVGYRMKKTRS